MAGILLNPGKCCGCGGATLPCSPCAIPQKNLTLSWTNPLVGNGSTPLVYGGGGWTTDCVNQMLFQLACAGSVIQLSATYFLAGTCPSGQPQTCTSPGSNPLALTLDSYACSPLYLHYTVTGSNCPALWSNGYTSFAVTE